MSSYERIVNIIIYSVIVLPLLIVVDFLLGLKEVAYINIVLTLILYILLFIQKYKKIFTKRFTKFTSSTFNLVLITGLLSPSFGNYEYKERTISGLMYLIPAIIFMVLYIYHFKKNNIKIED